MPHYGGSTSNYYSLLEANQIGASAIFLNEEIDNGPLVCKEVYPPPKNLVDFDHLYDPAVRSRVLLKALKLLEEHGCERFLTNNNFTTGHYYIIHPVLKHMAILGRREPYNYENEK
ncbi:hypothetical protein N8932_03420 [Alphaproteobacteria bacterium]|nr:hypothetical protein [Alphaproteobacteria bacterium]